MLFLGFFGVFDGHRGANAAEFVSKILEKNVANEMLKRCEGDWIEMTISLWIKNF